MRKYDVIKSYCIRKGVTISQLERDLGFARGSISKIDSHRPSVYRITKIIDYLDIPSGDALILYAGEYENEEFIKGMVEELEKVREQTPIFEVSAGEGRYNGQYATEYVEDEKADEEHSWCTVCGESMVPELKDGDRIRVHHMTQTTPSDLTVVQIDGENCTVKYVEIADTGVWLRALNKEVFRDRFYSVQEVMTLPVKIIGKVVEVRRLY